MGWLKDVAVEDMPKELQDSIAAQKKTYGTVLNSTRQGAHAPHVLLGAGAMSRGLSRSRKISGRLAHLLNLRVAAIVGCPL